MGRDAKVVDLSSKILAWCTSSIATGHQVSPSIRTFAGWGELLPSLEAHGLAPLAYAHLRAAEITVPPPAGLTLRALYLRQILAARRRFGALGRILAAFEAAEIDSIILKGAALAQLIYPEPGLRPMGDLDLLVPADRFEAARVALEEIGFSAAGSAGAAGPDKHLVVVGKAEGFSIRVELHHRLFLEERRIVMPIDPWTERESFCIDGRLAFCLGREAMLWHLCQHLVFHADVFTRIRLIWIADIIGFAEHFVDVIDWEHVHRDTPLVPRVLSLAHRVTPLSDKLQKAAAIQPDAGDTPSPESWGDFRGWPRFAVGALRDQGWSAPQILRDTFLPPRWWLRLHYGLAATDPLGWYRWILHPAEVLGRSVGYAWEQRAKAQQRS